jgi:hypothetical protein
MLYYAALYYVCTLVWLCDFFDVSKIRQMYYYNFVIFAHLYFSPTTIHRSRQFWFLSTFCGFFSSSKILPPKPSLWEKSGNGIWTILVITVCDPKTLMLVSKTTTDVTVVQLQWEKRNVDFMRRYCAFLLFQSTMSGSLDQRSFSLNNMSSQEGENIEKWDHKGTKPAQQQQLSPK